ncbi:MAG TPA: sodium:calcium antiporter, partial [Desulfobacteraceae bacterium]|nr:sodium:calcium antiporter [Desulfobacteraceae bacterium]
MNGLTVLSPLQALLAVAGGLAMLVGGGEMLVIGATRLARQSGMSMLLIGLTVVAFGTSVPELSVSLTASLQGHPDIMIGNVVGSNIANIGLILGLSALLQRLELNLQAVRIELLLVIAASIILMLCSAYGRFPRSLGIIFVLTLIVYTFLACRNHTNGQHSEQTADEEKTGPPSLGFISFLVLAGLALLTYGATIFIRG